MSKALVVALAVLTLAILATLAACGAPPAAKPAPAPEPPKDDDAWTREDTPLVVDWPAPRRAELQALLRRGGVIAATYGDGGLQLLPDCRLSGAYAYEPSGLKEEVVRLRSADAIRARLPGLAAEVRPKLVPGATLDLAIASVGRWVTTTKTVYARGLPEPCRTATHFVKAIATGAFALDVGSPALPRATNDVFDGASVGRDGDIDACRAKVDPRSPPAGCRAPIGLELARIDPRSEARARCEQGEEPACARWAGELDAKDRGEATVFTAKVVGLCRAGVANGCVLAAASPGWKDAPKADRKDVAERGCTLGSWGGCVDLARLRDEDGDAAGALEALTRACSEGATGCGELADRIEKSGTKEEKARLPDLRGKACLTSAAAPPSAPDCDRYAELRRRGQVAKAPLPEAAERVTSCEQYGDCFLAAAAQALGLGVPRDVAKAKASFQRWCAAEPGRPCELPRSWQ